MPISKIALPQQKTATGFYSNANELTPIKKINEFGAECARSISCPRIENGGHRKRISESLKKPLVVAASTNRSNPTSERSSSLKAPADVREVVDTHYQIMSKNNNYSKTGSEWYNSSQKLNVWTYQKAGKKKNIKSITGQNFFPQKGQMINVKSIKKAYDELIGIETDSKIKDLEPQLFLKIRNQYQEYAKQSLRKEENFMDFMKHLYPNMKENEMDRIKEILTI